MMATKSGGRVFDITFGDENTFKEALTALRAHNLMVQAQKTASDRNNLIRDRFSMKHPHYTPPKRPGSRLAWVRWVDAQIELWGPEGARERFPLHFIVLGPHGVIDEKTVSDFENLSYRNG